MSEINGTCENCKWWRSMAADPPGAAGGFCHRGKPAVMENGKTVWPFTLSNDWCGQFQPRDDRAARLLGTNYMNRSEGEAA